MQGEVSEIDIWKLKGDENSYTDSYGEQKAMHCFN
tara:strand:- start:287 stop:391 length:105 start_codon:yes stop_codon:yes gene_type:complete